VVLAAPSLPSGSPRKRNPCPSRKRKRARRKERGRGDKDVRGSIAKEPWEDNAHARVGTSGKLPPLRGADSRLDSLTVRQSGLGRRETPGPPVKPRRAQTLRGAHAVKAAEASRERARCGCTQFRYGWQKSIGRIARLARREVKSLVADAKASRALAGRKLEAPPDAGHGPREGETVRGTALSFKRWRMDWQAGFGSLVHETTEGGFGLTPVLLSPAMRSGGPSAPRSTP